MCIRDRSRKERRGLNRTHEGQTAGLAAETQTLMAPRQANSMPEPGSIAFAVTKLRTEAEGDGEVLTARAPLRIAFHEEET